MPKLTLLAIDGETQGCWVVRKGIARDAPAPGPPSAERGAGSG